MLGVLFSGEMAHGAEMEIAEEIFAEALELESSEREGWLVERCRDDAKLRRQVDALLEAAGAADSFFSDIPAPHVHLSELPPEPLIPATARYTPEHEIGRGGMAVVVKVQDKELNRPLAMKVLQRRLPKDTSSSVRGKTTLREARFLEEAQITAQLEHPGIVPVHDLGELEDGSAFFTMPLVRGRELDQIFDLARVEKEDWNRSRAVSLLVRACQAVAYAHSKGVLHRDLKCSNIMVGRFGEVYVMDWGLAKAIDSEDPADDCDADIDTDDGQSVIVSNRASDSESGLQEALVTLQGQVIGTPAFMSPEQARGAAAEIDERADVYALGGILYRLLAGQEPYAKSGKGSTSMTVLEQVRNGPPASVRSMDPTAPLELVSICEKAMARDQEKRYDSCDTLAEDLQAWLDGRVVSAFEQGRQAEFRKWVQRNRALAGAIVAGLACLLLGLFLSLREGARARDQAARANAAQVSAELALVDMYTAYGLQSGDRGDPKQAALWFAKAASMSASDAHRQRMNRERVTDFTRRLAKPVVVCGPWFGNRPQIRIHPSERYFMVNHVIAPNRARVYQLNKGEVLALPQPFEEPSVAWWSPRGDVLMLGNDQGDVGAYRFPELDPLAQLKFGQPVQRLDVSQDGTLLAVAGGQAIGVWPLAQLDGEGQRYELPSPPASLSFSPTAQYLVCGTEANEALLFQTDQFGRGPVFTCPHLTADGWDYPHPQFSSDERMLVTRHLNTFLGWWDLETKEQVRIVDVGGWILGMHRHPTEDELLVQSETLITYQLSTGEELRRMEASPHLCTVWGLTTDMSRVIVGSPTLADTYFYNSREGTREGFDGPVNPDGFNALAFTPSGEFAVTCSSTIQVWSLPSQDDPHLETIPTGSTTVAMGGRYHLISEPQAGRMRRVEISSGEPAGAWMALDSDRMVGQSDLSADGTRAFTVSYSKDARSDSFLESFDAITGEAITKTPLPIRPYWVRPQPQGDCVAVLDVDKTNAFILVETATGKITHRWDGIPQLAAAVAFSADGSTLFYHGLGPLHAFDVESGERLQAFAAKDFDGILGISFSPDGKLMACTGAMGEVLLVDWETRDILRRWELPAWGYTLDFSSDGRHVACLSKDYFVRVWDCETGELAGLPFTMNYIGTLAFSADDETLVTLESRGNLDVWDWRLGLRVAPTRSLDIGEPMINKPDEGAELTLWEEHGIAGGYATKHYRFKIRSEADDTTANEDLMTQTELLSGQRISESGIPINLTAEEWLERWQRMNPK